LEVIGASQPPQEEDGQLFFLEVISASQPPQEEDGQLYLQLERFRVRVTEFLRVLESIVIKRVQSSKRIRKKPEAMFQKSSEPII